MPADGTSAPAKLRYLAQPPWIGPILDATRVPVLPLRVAAAADPLLGEAHAVALVPVPPGPVPPDPALGWIVAPKCDAGGRFRLEVPVMLWHEETVGLLMILLYDQTAGADARHFPELCEPISTLPHGMKEDVQEAIGSRLKKSPGELEPGLIEYEDSQASELAFAVASCQYPAGFLDGDPAESSYRRLAGFLDRHRPGELKCLLLLGDQVYLDATAGLFDPTAQHDRFDLPYERLLGIKPLREVLRRVPAYMMLDDHEIEDNWEPVAGADGSERSLVEGRRAYFRYQRMAGPEALPPLGDSREPAWYIFTVGDFPFFMADTRTERQPRCAERIEEARIMSKSQFDSLLGWLEWHQNGPHGDIPKFVASPACFLPRHRRAAQNRHPASALRSDGWDGYPASFHELLGHIAEKGIRNVIFLSGDEHVSFATRADITDKASGNVTRIYSIHSSALYSPFPFANTIHDSLFCDEDFSFGKYRCELVPLDTVPGDGFALLRVWRGNGQWRMGWRFDRGSAPGAEKSISLA